MLIDIHTHTSRYSGCSILSPERLIHRASQIGLEGLVITEHNHFWSSEEVQELRGRTQSKKLLILRGQEVDTTLGHMLVYGYLKPVRWGIHLAELGRLVHDAGGAVVYAHPYRWGGIPGKVFEEHSAAPDLFDALEAYNGNCRADEMAKAVTLAGRLGIPIVGGSDAHSDNMVGLFCTDFPGGIENESDLVNALRKGAFTPCRLDEKGFSPLPG